MRVLHLVKTSFGATWALQQMKELVKLGVEVHVALPADGPVLPQYQAAGIAVHAIQTDLPVRRPWYCSRLFRQVRDLVACVRPDVIHSHFVGTTLTMRLALGKMHRVPRIFQVPGPLHLEHRFFRATELSTAGNLDYWIGSCKRTCELYLRSGVSQERLFLSYYGFDLARLVNRQLGRLREELRADTTVRLVGMVAYMYAPRLYLGQTRGIKGHEDLIDALAICLRTEPNILGVLIGGAWNNATDYEKRVRAYGKGRCGDHLAFLGTRNDVLALYPDLDVAVHPSHSENVGGAAESLLLAIPTIATNVGGLPDLVRHGETGWLVPARDPNRLAEAILEALHDLEYARKLALQGQALARRLFDVRETAREVLAIYEDVCARGPNC